MKMKSAEFVALSACTMLFTALGIDIMLPAFGVVRGDFNLGSDSTATAQIIAIFFMGQIAQIIYGTLADRYGRLAILRVGFLFTSAAASRLRWHRILHACLRHDSLRGWALRHSL
jgi:MFS transporter, DHA1 family, multidrug resistance protein